MSKKKKETDKKQNDRKIYAFLATFLSIIGFIIAIITKREDRYVMYYAKQSLVIFIIGVIASIIQGFFVFIPIIGWMINTALSILVFILWIVSWIYALSGETKPVPVIGEYAEKIKL